VVNSKVLLDTVQAYKNSQFSNYIWLYIRNSTTVWDMHTVTTKD